MKRAKFLEKVSKMIGRKDKEVAERDLSRVLGKKNSDHFLKSTPQALNKLMYHKKKRSISRGKDKDKAKSLYSNFFLNQPQKKKKTSNFLLSGSHNFRRGIDMRYNKDFDRT